MRPTPRYLACTPARRRRVARSGKAPAFTLLELIVVIVVLAILALLAIPTFTGVIRKSKDATAEATLSALGRDVAALAALNGGTITSAEIQTAVSELPSSAAAPGRFAAGTAYSVTSGTSTAPGQIAYDIASGGSKVGLAEVAPSGDVVYALASRSGVQTWAGCSAATGAEALGGPSGTSACSSGSSSSSGGSSSAQGSGGATVIGSTTTTTTTPLAAPTGLTAVPGDRVVTLSWKSVSGATSYVIDRNGTKVASTSLTSYTDTGLTNGTSYAYTVAAAESTSTSPLSVPVSATPAAPSLSSYEKAVLADHPIGYWPLSGGAGATTAADLSGNGTTLTYENSPTLSNPGPVPGSTAATFNGSSQYATNQTPAPATYSLTKSWTMAAWVYPTSSSAKSQYVVASDNGFNNWVLWFSGSTFQIYDGTASLGTMAAPLHQWDYVVYTYNGSTLVGYVNGAVAVSRAASFSLGTNTMVPLNVGDSDGLSNYWHGSLAEIALYAHPLSAAQVAAYYFDAGTRPGAPALSPNTSSITVNPGKAPSGATYDLYRNGTEIQSGLTSAYTDTSVQKGTTYAYAYRWVTSTQTGRLSSSATASTVTAYELAVLADNPIGFWPLSDTSGTSARDLVQGGMGPGTYGSGIALAQRTAPTGNAAPTFPGSAGVALPGTSSSVSSMDMWVYIPSTSDKGAFMKYGPSSSGWGVGVGGSSLDNPGNQLIGLYEDVAFIQTGFSLGTGWHYIAMTVSGSTATFYVDGARVYQTTPSAPISPGNAASSVGSDGGTFRYFTGSIADPALYSSVLSATQVASHYSAG